MTAPTIDPSEVVFEPESHSYFWGMERLPSVSELMRPITDPYLLGIPEHILEWKRELGVATHLACDLWDKGILDEEALDPEIVPYLEAWKKFTVDMRPGWDAAEQVVVNSAYRYAGTIDRIGGMNGNPVIVDIKTTLKGQPHHAVQLALYSMAAHAEASELIVVRLKKDGDYCLDMHSFDLAQPCALGLIEISRWQRANTPERKRK